MTDWKEPKKTEDKDVLIIFCLFSMIVLMLVAPAHAMTITMSNPGGMSERDIIVYYPNDTMQGFYNSTSIITLDPNSSYIFALKPIQSNPLDDPTDWFFNGFWPAVQANYIMLIFLGILIVFWSRRRT